jgi:putative ATPase
MSSLFAVEQQAPDKPIANLRAPLAARLRPATFEEYAGQEHLLGEGCLLRRAIDADRFNAIILYGPPGTGKTSLAELIANVTDSHVARVSAVTGSVKDLRAAVEEARARRQLHDRQTILFVDEIHRFNKSQQDALLPHVESGIIRLIGATTENPFFSVVGPLISRAQVFQLQPLDDEAIQGLLRRALADPRGFPKIEVDLADDASTFLAAASDGDARKALSALELAVLSTPPGEDGVVKLDLETVQASIPEKGVVYGDDGHYDTISAFIKSMRNHDPDAATYYLARMIAAGEDAMFIARRIVIFASEDVGNADPQALQLAVAAMQAVERIGMPEGRIILCQAVTYCATCAKSRAVNDAIAGALKDVKNERAQPIPVHLRDAHYGGAKKLGVKGYVNPAYTATGTSTQANMSEPKRYYEPTVMGHEATIRKRMDWWEQQRRKQREVDNDQG